MLTQHLDLLPGLKTQLAHPVALQHNGRGTAETSADPGCNPRYNGWLWVPSSITGAYVGAKLQGKDATAPMIGAGLGTLGGATIGKGMERLQTTIPQFNIPKLTGAVAASAGSEYLGSSAQNLAEKVQQNLEKKSDAK